MDGPADKYESKNQQFYDRDAGQYDARRFEDAHGRRTKQRTQGMVADELRGGSFTNALEVGSGTGRVSVEVAKHVSHLTLVDISPEMLSRATQAVERVSPSTVVMARIGSLSALPLDAATIDVAVTINVFGHVSDIRGALKELGRVVRPNGRLLFSSTNLMSAYLPAGLLVNTREKAIGQDVPSCWRRPSELRSAALDAGFTIDRVQGQYYLPYGGLRVPGAARVVAAADRYEERRSERGELTSHAPWLLFSCTKGT